MRRGRCGRKMMKMTSFLTSLTPSFLARYVYMLPVLRAASLRLKNGSVGLGRRLPQIPIQTPPWEGEIRVSGEAKHSKPVSTNVLNQTSLQGRMQEFFKGGARLIKVIKSGRGSPEGGACRRGICPLPHEARKLLILSKY